MKEGTVKKGGQNAEPTTERPPDPKGQKRKDRYEVNPLGGHRPGGWEECSVIDNVAKEANDWDNYTICECEDQDKGQMIADALNQMDKLRE